MPVLSLPSLSYTNTFNLLKTLEESNKIKYFAYADSDGIPTIGIGMNLRVSEVQAKILDRVFAVRPTNQSDPVYLAEDGYRKQVAAIVNRYYTPGTNGASSTAYGATSTQLIKDLDAVAYARSIDTRIPASQRLNSRFQITESATQTVLNDLVQGVYQGAVETWLGQSAFASLKPNQQATLLSLSYNGGSGLLGQNLKAAITSGNMAEAWYEIAYRSNGDQLNGIATRRFVEANAFYVPETPAEIKQFEAMINKHRSEIDAYNRKYNSGLQAAKNDYRATDAYGTLALGRQGLNLLADDAGKITTQHCFPAGTSVLLASGRTKPIEDITTSDVVQSFNDQGVLVAGNVVNVWRTANQPILLITTQHSTIRTTPGHKFLFSSGEFKEIAKAIAGTDSLVLADGTYATILSLTEQAHDDVYNFTVADTHTYIAGGYRVHNESLSLYQATDLGGIIGESIGGQIASIVAGNDVSRQLVYGAVGKTLTGFVGSKIQYSINPPLNNNGSIAVLDNTALLARLPGAFTTTALAIGGAALTKSLAKALGTNSPLAQIGLGTLTTSAIGYAWNQGVIVSLHNAGYSADSLAAMLHANVTTSTAGAKLVPFNLTNYSVNIASGMFGSYISSQIFKDSVGRWNILSESLNNQSAAWGGSIGGMTGAISSANDNDGNCRYKRVA